MQVIIEANYAMLSRRVAEDVIRLMGARKQPLLCTASGDTPTGLYRELVERRAGSDWRFIGLDEWVGMNGADEGSCRQYTDLHLFHPLSVDAGRIFFFDGRGTDLQHQCSDAIAWIAANGGIDVAILGVGMNGHIGLNEPGVSPALEAHVMNIDSVTQRTGQKYFAKETSLKQGITLGVAALLKVKHPVVILSGKHKASIAAQVIEGEISDRYPASLLRQHPQTRFYLDADAASQLTTQHGQ